MYTNFFNIFTKTISMASYSAQVNVIHKTFQNAVKRAKTKQTLNKAYSVHKRAHERILKTHLREEIRMINKAKKKLG
jgi:S-methylmethionine-dependent homocysteine/selenocysteine methylase